MRNSLWTTAMVPYGADQTVYVVMDGLGHRGTFAQEREVERADLETVIADLMSGQFNDPTRVVAFNTLEHWSEDVSEDIPREIQTCCNIEGGGVPDHLQDFIERSGNHGRQLTLRLAYPASTVWLATALIGPA